MKQTESNHQSTDYRQSSEYQAANAFLTGRINYERAPKMPYSQKAFNLERMSTLLDLLGNPHQQIPTVHIAGTKGKGSTAALLTSALQAQGLRCGSYTSPHLHHIEERFRLNGVPCPPAAFQRLVEHIRPHVEQLDATRTQDGVTYFEIATALGFLYFLDQKADVAIVEVGLGGRLDSTNVCEPIVSVITSISLDHTKQLGDTLAKIASEKAGIIKDRVPVVSGVINESPRQVIQRTATEHDAKLFQRDRDFRYAHYRTESTEQAKDGLPFRNMVDLQEYREQGWQTVLSNVRLGIRGEHQAANASVAWAVTRLLPDALRPDENALRTGFETAQCEARIECIGTDPLIVIDAAHNVASVAALCETLDELPVEGQRWLILATTRGKDVPGMLDVLVKHFDQIVLTRYENNPRGHEITVLREMTEAAIEKQASATKPPRVRIAPTPAEAWNLTSEHSQPTDAIYVAGSFFIAAELRELIGSTEPNSNR